MNLTFQTQPHSIVRRFLKLPEVKQQVGMCRSAIYDAIKKGEFPAQIKIGDRAVAWNSNDIDAWMENRINAAKAPSSGGTK